MNHYDSDPSVLMTPAESAVYSELVETIAKDFNGKISQCQFKVTVTYPAMNHETTYTLHLIETAAKVIARSRAGNCPVSYRVTLKPRIAAEHAAFTRNRRYTTLADYIRSV